MQSNIINIFGFFVLLCLLQHISAAAECGILNTKGKQLPWVVNVYHVNDAGVHEFICSGTIIAKSVILTASHCFYDDIKQRRKPGRFFIITGQHYTAWNGGTIQGSQIREITQDNVIISKKYTGIKKKYSDNIAIIKLTKQLNINNFTKTACIDWDNEFAEPDFETHLPQLKVTTWSTTKNGTINILQPTFVIYDKCFDISPEAFQPYLTFDKMCAQIEGVLINPCTGSGLYAFNKNKNRWFLMGIGSEITILGTKTIITFTKIHSHLNWLSNTVFLQLDQ